MITLCLIVFSVILFVVKCEILTLTFLLFLSVYILYKIFSEAPKHF